MHYNKEKLPNRLAKGDPTLLLHRMRQIWLNQQERIAKNRCGLFEVNPMLLLVAESLDRVPDN